MRLTSQRMLKNGWVSLVFWWVMNFLLQCVVCSKGKHAIHRQLILGARGWNMGVFMGFSIGVAVFVVILVKSSFSACKCVDEDMLFTLLRLNLKAEGLVLVVDLSGVWFGKLWFRNINLV
ncbi:unnamed protein product [Ceratitis capitata]|uniref:(Mediterranean fruit fly) hypothetical protein n=1 Tax=Ceratitis capitata TaxID=7213 RepID=A0A811V5J8_CERCA|nr:unnamed protein product [Ceratitis capitata]